MNRIGERNWALLERGLKTTGSHKEAYFYVEEQLYVDEADTIFKFLNWCEEDPKNRSLGWGNYEARFQQFLKKEK